MNQVSRPMQIALAAVLVFAVVWFAVLRPKDPAADVAAAPVTPAQTTPAADAGGAAAESALGSTVESAKNAGVAADAAVKERESQTGEDAPAADAPAAASTPAADAPTASTPTETAKTGESSGKPAPEAAEKSSASPAQARADKVVKKVAADLAKRRAVVVLVWSKSGQEDRAMHKRITKLIDRRNGRVRIYLVPVAEIGRYDGLLAGLSLGQIPSTVVIAPNNQAKVLGGMASVPRIDRLTSSATQIKPVATTP